MTVDQDPGGGSEVPDLEAFNEKLLLNNNQQDGGGPRPGTYFVRKAVIGEDEGEKVKEI